MRIGLSNKITQSRGPVSSAPPVTPDVLNLDMETQSYGRKNNDGHYYNLAFPYDFVIINPNNGDVIVDPFANYRADPTTFLYGGIYYINPITEPLNITLTLDTTGTSWLGSNTYYFGAYPAALTVYFSRNFASPYEPEFSEEALENTTLTIVNKTYIIGAGGKGGTGGYTNYKGDNSCGGGGGGGTGWSLGLGGTATSSATAGVASPDILTAGDGGTGGINSGLTPVAPGAGRPGGPAIAVYQQKFSNRRPTLSIINEPASLIWSGAGGGGGSNGKGTAAAGHPGGTGGAPYNAGSSGLGLNAGAGGVAGKAIDESEFGTDNYVNVETTNNNTDPNTFRGSEADY